MPNRIPVLLCIDCEPEARALEADTRPDWDGFEHAVDQLTASRFNLQRATDQAVHFSWFLRMDPQIEQHYGSAAWPALRYSRQLHELQKAGDEIGLHIHPWRWDQSSRFWIADYSDEKWGEHCIRSGYAAFESSFGRPCRSSRNGDRWINDRIALLAEHLGARFDLTAEPGKQPERPLEHHRGSVPDYSATPRHPFVPSENNCLVADPASNRDLRMIPLSTEDLEQAQRMYEARLSQPISPRATASNSCQGWIDHVDSETLGGWACDTSDVDRIVEIEVLDAGRPIARLPAGAFRPDLREAGLGEGTHAFHYPVSHRLRDGLQHEIRVRLAGTNYELAGGPVLRSFSRRTTEAPEYRTLDIGFDSALICALLESLLADTSTRHLALVVRTNSFSSENTRINVQQTLDFLARHSKALDLRFATPEQACAAVF